MGLHSNASAVRKIEVTIDKMPILNRMAQVIFDKKGMNILGLDVRGVSTVTDYVIIAEGQALRHATALGDAVIETLKQEGYRPIHTEGLQEGNWVVIDFLDIMVHIFAPGVREKYCLEDLWKDGQIIDLNFLS